MESLKGKFVEVHLDANGFPKDSTDDVLKSLANKEIGSLMRIGYIDEKSYAVVRGVVAGDDKRGISIVDPKTGTPLVCGTADMDSKVVAYIRDCVKAGVYKLSESEEFFRELGSSYYMRSPFDIMAPCPFKGGH